MLFKAPSLLTFMLSFVFSALLPVFKEFFFLLGFSTLAISLRACVGFPNTSALQLSRGPTPSPK